MKKTMKKTAAALCIAATLVSVAAPAMAVSPAEYMSTAALEECNTATVAQVESLINQIGTVTTAPEQKEKAPQSDVDRLMEGLNAESIRKLREYAELLLLGQEKEEKKP